MSKKNKQSFSQMYLADVLKGEVEAWTKQGWHGVTQTTLELFNYWFKRDEDAIERFHLCQQRAIETLVYCHEILQAKTLDEAHHVHGKKAATGEELVWRQFMNVLHNRLKENHEEEQGLFLQIDFSATPFYGSAEKREYFPHIIYDYDLLNAMQDMLVKQLFLEQRQAIAGASLEKLDFRAERHEPEGSHKNGNI